MRETAYRQAQSPVVGGTVSKPGQQDVGVSNPNLFQTTFNAPVYGTDTGGLVHGVRRQASRRKPAKPKTVLIASARAVVRAHGHALLRLKPSKAALKTLRRAHRLKVTLKLTVSARGHATRTISRTVTLKA